jgi:hypothetical protein
MDAGWMREADAAIALLGGFVVVASQTFAPAVTAWLAFSIAIAVLVIGAVSQLQAGRGMSSGCSTP